ncbi:hypothetical protein PIB30_080186 [Stylosanthes scabra]|uniref:Retrotransposon gag domain-containing protein n=1 Tax=Stylosanthes scabra TaxID=79078 RepID=A0ABU6QSS2_9FABA|nr:hypothetical protein [Stylosanthes scabra]
MQFKQGGLSLAEYIQRFEDFCHFSQVCQGNPISFENWKCMKFETGLRDVIQLQVSSLGIRNFAELVEKCQRVDDCCKRMTTFRNARTNLPPRNFDCNLAPQGRNFKRNNQHFRNFSHGGGNHPNNDGNGN